MPKKAVKIVLLLLIPFWGIAQNEENLSLTDSVSLLDSGSVIVDTQLTHESQRLGDFRSWLSSVNKTNVSDIQQENPHSRNLEVFVILILILVIVTFIKIAFDKDVTELIQSSFNSNLAQQIYRSGTSEISLASILLQLNFVVTSSLFVQIVLVKYFDLSTLNKLSSFYILTFLFTFFYLAKMLSVKVIGFIFGMSEDANEYVYNFSIVCKMIGLTLIPALFVFSVADMSFFNLTFIVSVFVIVFFVFTFLIRGLSTGYKFLYRSVYHFFIYVCVVEISPIFLLFKLLTKTIT